MTTTAANPNVTPTDQSAPRLKPRWRALTLTAGSVVLLILAVTMRLITVERHLPVMQHIDESFRFIHAYQVRPDAPLGTQYGQIAWAQGFPPVQVWVGVWSQRLVERFVQFPYPPDYVRALRGLSAALNVGTVLLLALAGWRLGHRLGTLGRAVTGFMAALVWAVAPRIIGTGNLALMDPLIFPMVAAALLFTVMAIQDDAAWAVVGSLLMVIAAIYTKYSLVYALWLPCCAAAVLIWRRRWRAVPWIAGMAVLSAVTAGWLVFGHHALALENREADRFRENGVANMLSISRNWDNLLYTLEESTGVGLFFTVIAAGVIAYAVARWRHYPAVNVAWLAVIVPYALACILLASSVDILRTWEPHWYRVRYTLPAAAGLLLLWGLSAAQAGAVLVAASQEREWPWLRWVAASAAVALVGTVTVPAVNTNIALARSYQQEHMYTRIWDWSDASLPNPDGKVILAAGGFLEKTWNRPWSGYNRPTTFEWVLDNNPALTSHADFWRQGITYFAATEADMQGVYNTAALRDWVEPLYLLKTIAPAPVNPHTVYVYRLLPPQVTVNVTYGENIRMVGYDLNKTAAAPGDDLRLRPYWQAASPPQANDSMFVHLLPAGETAPVAQYDGAPASGARLPVTWDDPDEVVVGAWATVPLPGDLPPGAYRLALGLYNFETGQRLPIDDTNDAHIIEVTIE